MIVSLILITNIYAENPFSQVDVECPFGSHRSVNKSGQCAWNSLENILAYQGVTKYSNLTNEDPRCQGGAGPGDLARVLHSYGIKFKQSYGNRKEGVALIKEAMLDGRACLFSVPGHAMNIIHFDENANRVIIVDNNPPRTNKLITMDRFYQIWDGWVLVVYSDEYNKNIKPHLQDRKIRTWYYLPEGTKRPEINDIIEK